MSPKLPDHLIADIVQLESIGCTVSLTYQPGGKIRVELDSRAPAFNRAFVVEDRIDKIEDALELLRYDLSLRFAKQL